MVGVYKITNTVNGKVYIGESVDIEERWKIHKEDLKNSKHHSYKLQNDYNTYEIENFKFEILQEIDKDLKFYVQVLILYALEDKYIKQYDSINNGYNIENTLEAILNGERPVYNNNGDNGVYIKESPKKKPKEQIEEKEINLDKLYSKHNINVIINSCKEYKFNKEFMSFAVVLRENGFNMSTVYQILRDINIINTNENGNKIIIDDPSMFYNKEYISYEIDTGEINSINYSPCISRNGFKYLLRKILEHSKNNNIIPFTNKYIKQNLLVN